MKFSAANLINASIVAVLAALGGALIVYSEFDDAPGGILIGLVLIAAAVLVGGRSGSRQR